VADNRKKGSLCAHHDVAREKSREVNGLVVKVIGRERVNVISAPFYDWLARRRTLRRLRELADHDLLINVGCGPNAEAGWVNVDIARGPGVDVVWDLRRGLPFRQESASAIFGEHVIEHLSRGDGHRLLRECYRILQAGGVLRLSTPDAAKYLHSYAGDGEFLRHPNFSEPIDAPLDRINLMMRESGSHLWSYDAQSLLSALKRAGFSTVAERAFRVSSHPAMAKLDSEARAFESLYVEATK
jgi:predicted SAM-dependent methyltransferase